MSVPPSGLVHYTNNTSQSYSETGELLTYDEIMECEAEDFVEYINELAEKAILLKHREDPTRGVIIKPSDSSRYFERGKWKAQRNIRTRFGRHYRATGTFVTLTYDHEKYSRWEAWERLKWSTSTIFAGKRQLFLPVHLLSVLACRARTVAGHVKLQDNRVMDHPIYGSRGSHGVLKDPVPL